LAGTPCLTLDDITCIARNYAIDGAQVHSGLIHCVLKIY